MTPGGSALAGVAFVEAVGGKGSLKALARVLGLTEATLEMAARGLRAGENLSDLGDRGALLAVAVRLFPGPYAAADLLDVSGESLAQYGECLLSMLRRSA